VKLDRRSIPYRILQNGVRLGGLVAFSLVTSASAGPGPSAVVLAASVLVVGVVATLAWELARYRRYEYELSPDTVDIRSGVLSRREREIPYERIQNVDIAQNVVQRALGIAEVRLETAGGSDTEAQLNCVGRSEADRLQDAISRRKAGDAGTPTESEADRRTLFVLSDREHVVLGVVSADLRILGLLSVLLSAVAPRLARELNPQFDIVSLFGPAIALVGIVAFWVLSAVLQVFRYYGFTLTRRGEELRYERGLLQRYTGTIPLGKVQAVTVRENVLARALGYASLVIQTAGYAPGQDGSSVESAVPIAERDRAFALAREVEPVGDIDFERPPRRARTRYAVRYALGLVALVVALRIAHAATGVLPLWYLPLAALLAVPVAAHLAWSHKGYYCGDGYVVTRNGFWRRRTMVVPYDRVQTVFSSQTVFQRRHNLGSVSVDTAGGGGLGSGDAVALDLDAGVAERLRETVADRLQAALAGRRGRAET
jgi:putative membrane protein